jgi:putative peptidoglycan lipid II flippase
MKLAFPRLDAVDRRIFARVMAVGWMFALAQFFAVTREAAIAWRYGVSWQVDVYQLAFTITCWLPFTVTGIMIPVLVPRLVRLAAAGRNGDRFVAELNGVIIAVAVLLAVATALLAPLLPSLVHDLSPEASAAFVSATRILAPIAGLTCLGGFLVARLQLRDPPTYALSEAIPPFVITTCILLLPPSPVLFPLLAGALTGSVLQLLWLAHLKRRDGVGLGAVRLGLRSEEWASLWPLLATMGIAQLLINASIPIDQLWAAGLGEGAVATLSYASRVVGMFTSIGVIVLARGLLPHFSRLAEESHYSAGLGRALRWAGLCLAGGSVIAAIAWAAAPIVVTILLERGAFTAADTAAVVEALRYGVIQIPMFLATIVMVQWLSAARRYRAILFANAAALIVKIGANAALVPALGLAGIFLSTALMYTASLSALAWLSRHPSRPGDA